MNYENKVIIINTINNYELIKDANSIKYANSIKDTNLIKDANSIKDTEFRNETRNYDETREELNDISLPNLIYRFKFTEEFMEILYEFSKIHQYDERKDFKEAWKIWTEENNDIINKETERLNNLGYKGNIIDKMFKSARYYFRKKSTEKKQPKKRRIYQSVQRGFLEAIDLHIRENINNDEFKPSTGFDSFCKKYVELLKEEVTKLCKNGLTDPNEIKNKIKKTYKNRYFILVSK